jgi:hypothetical protein
MKPVDYPNNGRGLYVQYHIMREGPSYFSVCYKNSSVLRQDPKDAWRVMGCAKFTDNSQALKQWCLDIHDKYNKKKLEPVKDGSFASEALETEEDPSSNTKMVV